MPKDLGEGLYLTAVGMGVVFFSLIILMLILIVLKKLFPGEEVAESAETEEAPAAIGMEVARHATGGPLAASEGPTEGGVLGTQVAAMAVAKYLAMEQQGQVEQAPVMDRAATLSQEDSRGSTSGRDSAWGNQGRRPPPYGQKTQSAYQPKDSVRE